jgi:tetratricopeptide (TPR) repeat protein
MACGVLTRPERIVREGQWDDKRSELPCYSGFKMNPATSIVRGLCAVLLSVVLGACATSGKKPAAEEGSAGDPNALVLGAEVALQRGEYLEAAKAYLRAAMSAEDEALAEQATRVAYEHSQWSIVEQAAARWLSLNHTNEEARRYAAFAALHLYRLDSAAEHLSTLLETAYINPQAGFLALLPQLSEEAPEAAVTAVLQKLVAKYPDVTEAHYALAQAALQSDNFALGLAHAQKARELGSFWAPAGLLLARAQLMNGQTDQALATARAVLEQDSQDSHRLEYALMLIQAGQEEEGRKQLAAIDKTGNTALVVERALADIDFQTGNRDSAAKRFSNLVSTGRFVYESLFYLGAIAESRQAWEDALQLYGRVTSGEYAVAAQSRAARIKTDQQGLEAGVKHLEEFASTRPQYRIETIAARAALLADEGDDEGALALLDDALKKYPDAVDLKFARVFRLEASDRVDDALEELREIVASRPGDPVALNALGYTLVDRTRHHREGHELIEQALRQTPDNGAVLDSMGWALHRLGRHEEALKQLEHAKRRISDPEVDAHLGAVLIALGRKDEARDMLMRAIERYPENEKLKERLQELESKRE